MIKVDGIDYESFNDIPENKKELVAILMALEFDEASDRWPYIDGVGYKHLKFLKGGAWEYETVEKDFLF